MSTIVENMERENTSRIESYFLTIEIWLFVVENIRAETSREENVNE